MRNPARRAPVRRRWPSTTLGACLVVVAVFASACGTSSPTARPSASLLTLDFTPRPGTPAPTTAPTRTPRASQIAASWPVGWDVAFCTALADTTVAHELVIDVERAIAEDNRTDAQGLAVELAQTAPIASTEVNRLGAWEPATELKADLITMLDLDAQAADAYKSYFLDGVRSGLRDARQLRNQVSKQVGPINAELAQLSALGMACPGADLKLETF